MDFLEFSDATQEVRGCMNPGRLKLTNSNIIFKNSKTGKIEQLAANDIALINWQRLASGYGVRIFLENGQLHRFGGFRENDQEKLSKFFSVNYKKEMDDKDFSIKGWNWGTAKFNGSVLTFDIAKKAGFEVPLGNVSHCTSLKNEVTLEFHQNDDAPISLMELRFHVPADTTENEPAQEFLDNVLAKASIIQATGDAIATFTEVQCLTPRGRYDIKVFPSFVQLHGKTFDYKIPLTTVLRLFLLPHRDGRQMFFVVSLDPPIKQGQTRYHFLILLFGVEEEIAINLGLSVEEIQEKYDGKLDEIMKGYTYEVFSKIMKALVQRKVTVPGNYSGASGTPAIGCSYKAAAGFMYPLERGFIYVHKPPMHIRFEEISCVNFARSGGSTRSFDFEIETKNGVVHIFSSIEKEEYGKLFDFVTSKGLTVKNRGTANVDRNSKKKQDYKDDLVDSDAEDEPDAYLARVKDEAKERMEVGMMGGGSSDDESDESFNPGESGSDVAEEYDSNPATTSSSDSDSDNQNPSKKHKKEKKKKSAKTVKEPGMRKPRKPKKEKDENKPKRPQSSYMLWLNENRENMKKQYPGISTTELAKKAGEQWKTISDKTKWEKQAAEAKKVYLVAMEEYKNSSKVKEEEKPKSSKSLVKSVSKKSSPVKTGSFKSKEYITSSDDSSDEEKKKPIKKKKSNESEEKMEVSENDESAGNKESEESEASETPDTSDSE